MAIAVAIRGTPLHSTANTGAQTMTDAGTPTAGVALLAVSVNRGVSTGPSAAYTGYGLTWTAVGNFGWASSANIAFDMAISTGADSTDPVSTFASSTGRHMTVYEITGISNTAAILGGIVRDQGSSVYIVSGSGNTTSQSLTLAAAANAANRGFSAFEHVAAEVTTPRTNWAELDDGSFATPNSGSETQWRSDAFETTASATWATSSVCGGAALELIAATQMNLAALGVG